jgi:cell division protease FtsH
MQFKNDNNNSNEPDNSNTPPEQPNWQRWLWPGLLLFFLIWTILSSGSLLSTGSSASQVPYSTVRNEASNNIEQIVFEGNVARGIFRTPVRTRLSDGREANVTRFTTNIPSDGQSELLEILREDNPQALVNSTPQETSPLLLLLINFGPLLLIILFFLWMSRRAQGQMNGVFGFGRSQAREYSPDTPRVTFDDVAGQDSAKQELQEVVDFLKNPDKYISLGARIPRGVLLVGPPGTGKTLLARAVAGEASVSYYSIAASEFVEMFVGVGASRVRDLFNKAKENSPSIVFIDEIDAVGRQRGAGLGGGNDEREQTLNQMLAELDGFEQASTVIVMAATNRPDVLDPALLRPGRFDRQVTVDLPDREGRLSILKIHTRGKPLAEQIDLTSIASATIGFSGADIANLANEAALSAARYNRKVITQKDFTTAFERIILGNERPPLSNQQERRVVAYHEAGHAVVAALTPGANEVLKVTITPRGQALGITAMMPSEDLRNYPRGHLEAQIRVGLGGRVAEEIVFNDITTGAAGDIRMITNVARRMVTEFGMSELGTIDYSNGGEQPFLGYSMAMGNQFSDGTAEKIDAEVFRLVETAYQDTKKLLLEHRDKLEAVAQTLLKTEVLERSEFLEIMGIEGRQDNESDKLLNYHDDEEDAPSQITLPANNVESTTEDTADSSEDHQTSDESSKQTPQNDTSQGDAPSDVAS